MNPELIKAARAAMQLPDGADVEGYMRQATGGKYGFDDATAYLKTINAGVTPSSVARSVAHGVTMGNAADMIDRANAMPAPSDPLSQALSHAAQSIRGSGQDFRARDAAYAQAHPVLNAVGNVSGGVGAAVGATAALPEIGGAWLAKAPAALRALLTTLKGTAKGLGMGMANAYGAQEPGEKDLTSTATSLPALGGAAMGTLAPILTGGFNYLAQPAKQAMNRFGTAVTQSKGVQALLATLEKYKAAGLEKEVTMGDLSPAMAAARDLAVTGNQEASQSVGNTATTRQAGQIPRLIENAKVLTPEFGSETPSGSARLAYLKRTQDAWAEGPDGYGSIRADTPTGPNTRFATAATAEIPMTPGARQMASLLEGGGEQNDPIAAAKAIIARPGTSPQAAKMAQEYLDAKGGGAAVTTSTPGVFDEPIVQGAVRRAQDNGLSQDMQEAASDPTFGKVLAIKNRLQGKAQAAFKSGDGDSGRAYAAAAQRVDQHLADNVPDYMAITQEYAQRSGLRRAVQKGMDAWNSGDTGQLLRTAQGMSPAELLEFRRGLASSMYQKFNPVDPKGNIDRTFLDGSVEGQLGKSSGAMQAKLKLIFGDAESYGTFMTHAAHEDKMFAATQAGGGTQTARRLI